MPDSENTETKPKPLPYRTKDLNEAAFIWCQQGARLTEIVPETRHGGQKPETFFFQFGLAMSEADLKELMFAYANEETTVEPQAFVRKQTNLRDRLYACKRKFAQTSSRR